MEEIKQLSCFLAVTGLGLMSGALVAEGALLVPFWRSLPAEEFLAWYKQNAARLQRFFGPLEVGAAALTSATTALSWWGSSPGRIPLTVSAVLGVAVLAVFPLYFKQANMSFRTGAIAPEKVAGELGRWAVWHWARATMAMGAFGSATLAMVT